MTDDDAAGPSVASRPFAVIEALLHVGIDGGVPASNAAFAIAGDVFAELDSNQTGE